MSQLQQLCCIMINAIFVVVVVVCFNQDGDIDGTPLWPLIYYCLRCGDPRAAVQAVEHVP